MMTSSLTADQRLAQMWRKVELAYHNLAMAVQRGMSQVVLDRLVTKCAEAVAAYRVVEQEVGPHAFHP